MKLKPGTMKEAFITTFLIMCATANVYAAEKPIKITSAIDCKVASAENNYKGTCPYLNEVIKGDIQFKKLLLGTLTKFQVENMDGPESPLKTIQIDDKKYITGNKCQAHWCGYHNYTFIYSISDKSISGIYHPDGADPYFFGNPNEAEQEKLTEISP